MAPAAMPPRVFVAINYILCADAQDFECRWRCATTDEYAKGGKHSGVGETDRGLAESLDVSRPLKD